jgi:hypothetical protein
MSYRFPVILLLLSTTLCCATCSLRAQNRTSGHAAPPKCAVTRPNGSELPDVSTHHGPNDNPSDNSTRYGNGKLWTTLWPNGTVEFRPGGPGFVESDGSRSMKWPWWRGVRGKLTIEGRRLDGAAPPLRAHIPAGYGDTGFQSTALIFPTAGCWEVTGRVGDVSLTFVTRVVIVEGMKLVGTTGFEPATSPTPRVRDTRLRYVPTAWK